jgi:hypothetical protein
MIPVPGPWATGGGEEEGDTMLWTLRRVHDYRSCRRMIRAFVHAHQLDDTYMATDELEVPSWPLLRSELAMVL